MAVLLQQFIHRLLTGKTQHKQLALPLQHFCFNTTIKYQLTTRLGRFGRTNMCQRGMRIQYTLNQRLDFAATGLLAEQSGLHHLGVVEHHHITRLQPLW